MHEQDDEADGGADGDDDAFAVDGAVVGYLRRAGGEAFAGVGRRGGGGVGRGAVWGYEKGAVVVALGDDASVVVVVIVDRVPPDVVLSGYGRECACDYESEP